MTEEEHGLSRRRVKDEGIVQSRRTRVFSRALLKRLFTKWHFYIVVLLYALSVAFPFRTWGAGLSVAG
jgi:hypothetical protein